ncbi:MAG: FAD-binding protein [Sphingomonadales bacterium]|nr:FAD-binding protein [Sphingomonadales bacterium]
MNLTESFVKNLIGIAGAENVLLDTMKLQAYGRDYTEDLQYQPSCAVMPDSAEAVAAVLKICNEQKIPVYTRGAGTGLSGGSLPVNGGVVLSTEKLNKILHIDTKNFQATVQPGVINEVFAQAVAGKGLYYPPDPASKGSCYLGGNIAHGSGGPRAVKYGTTRDYVINLQIALPNGELIWTGANTVKNSTGFNLTQLMVGSEGLLGIVTCIVFRLIARPTQQLLLLVPFKTAREAAGAVNEVLLCGITPSALELMETSGIQISAEATRTPFPFYAAAAFYMLIELDGDNLEMLMQQAETLYPVVEKCGGLDVLIADSSDLKEQWWKVRRGIGETIKQVSVYKEEDTVVPRAALPDLLVSVKEIGNRYGFQSVCYGHAGDGNLHVNILKNNLSDQVWDNEIPKAIREIFAVCRDLGGTISGEHGVGLVQKPYLDVVFNQEHFRLMKGIKAVFDPNNIMNPGKWLD